MGPSFAEHTARLRRMYLHANTNRHAPSTQKYPAPGECIVTMDIEERFHHGGHFLHGQYFFKVLDEATFFAANSVVTDCFVVTEGLDMHIMKALRSGDSITAEAKVIRHGSRIILAEGRATNQEGELVAMCTATFMKSSLGLDEVPEYAGLDTDHPDAVVGGLDHVQLLIPDGATGIAREFWVDLVGLPEVPLPAPYRDRGGLWLAAGISGLHIMEDTDFIPQQRAHPALRMISIDDYEAMVRRLEAGGHEVMHSDPPIATRRMRTWDPFGNCIEFLVGTTG